MQIKEGDEWKAVFRTNQGLFEPTVMFFGLCNSPVMFQMMMNDILRDFIHNSVGGIMVLCVTHLYPPVLTLRTDHCHYKPGILLLACFFDQIYRNPFIFHILQTMATGTYHILLKRYS